MYFSDWTYRKIISSFLSILAIVLQHSAHANQWLYLTQTLRAVFKPALQWQYPVRWYLPIGSEMICPLLIWSLSVGTNFGVGFPRLLFCSNCSLKIHQSAL